MKFLALLLTLGIAVPVLADSIEAPAMKYGSPEEGYHQGVWEAGLGTAVYFSPFGATHNRRTVDYAVGVASVGYMFSDIKEWGFARGNFELGAEVFGGGVFEGRGNYVTGFTLWPRWNFVQPGWNFIPYAQLGLGAGLSDIDYELLGQRFNFNLNAAVGTRYYIKPNLALNAEFRYQHMSNANLADNNVGVNAQGVFLGVSWLY